MIAIAIGFGLIDGCPIPPKQYTPAWERGFVEPIREVQHVVETPVAWIGAWLRVNQQWSLYQAPGTDRFRMSIEGAGPDHRWRMLYRAGDPDHAEDAASIEHARVWGTWNPTDRPPGEYSAFCGWITGRMLGAHPELAAVRVQMEKITIGQGGFAGTGTFVWPYVRTAGAP